MVERKTELKRRQHRKKKMTKLKAKLAHAKDVRVESGGVVEGVELPGRSFVLGVQWHPEEGTDERLFEALVTAAATRP